VWWGEFWKPYTGQAVGGKLDLLVLIGGVGEEATIQWERNMWLRSEGDGKNFL
jgi:hypothetical protein